MVFSSPHFLFLFLPIVLAVYFVAPRRLRNFVLLAASLLFFYWGEQVYTALMLVSIAANWLFGLWVGSERASDASRKRGVVAAVVFNLTVLGLFKYADFVGASASQFLITIGAEPLPRPGSALGGSQFVHDWLLTSSGGIRLPIGISFFTFHAMSYVIDVYRRDSKVQRNPFDFALYISLFPQLIAGPIVRYKDVAAQLAVRVVTRDDFGEGVRRFIVGLGKKVLIANVVAQPCDAIFALPKAELSASLAWLGILCYTLQIYFDFSGYSDMAIGLGRMFGFRFLENFDHPYIARSITEFWRRWHISLSRWFRDYLYVPLGGNRKGPARTYFNLLVVFFLCGLWHGSSWTFVAWGLYHGVLLVFERVAFRERVPTAGAWRHLYVVPAVMVGWVLFRAADFGAAWHYLGAMAGGAPALNPARPAAMFFDAQCWLAIAAGIVGSTPWLASLRAWRQRRGGLILDVTAESVELAGLSAVLLLSVVQISGAAYNPFIYFRF